LKLAVDRNIVKTGGIIFREKFSAGRFFINEILFVFYNLLIGPIGFVGKFEWKGGTK
jgi:hypothetical protein